MDPPAPGTSPYPKYYAKKDMRKFRDIKLVQIPSLLMKRDYSPMGMMFAAKRAKYITGQSTVVLHLASVLFLGAYDFKYSWMRQNETIKKYH